MERAMIIAHYAENAGTATKAVSAEFAARCTGNAETATTLKNARKIIFSGDATAEATFDGAADLIVTVKNKKAECDAQGQNISETYATKNELAKYIAKSEICIEKIEGVPCLVVELDGKKYKFRGVEV